MKKIHVVMSVLTLAYLAGCGALEQIPTSTPTVVPLEATALPTPAAYEMLSPSKIKFPDINLTVEVSGALTQSTLDVNTNITIPVAFMSALPMGDQTPIFKETKIVYMSTPLKLQRVGGGGGGGSENGMLTMGGGESYQVHTPLTIGQKVRLKIAVAFSEYIKNGMQVPFTLDLTVAP